MPEWGFLTNHGRALLCIAHDPELRLRDIASTLLITERRAYGIVNDLAAAGYVIKERDGRRNRYQVQGHLPLPDPFGRTRTVGEVLDLLVGDAAAAHADGTEAAATVDGSAALVRRTAAPIKVVAADRSTT